jgi:hypothetical protein
MQIQEKYLANPVGSHEWALFNSKGSHFQCTLLYTAVKGAFYSTEVISCEQIEHLQTCLLFSLGMFLLEER